MRGRIAGATLAAAALLVGVTARSAPPERAKHSYVSEASIPRFGAISIEEYLAQRGVHMPRKTTQWQRELQRDANEEISKLQSVWSSDIDIFYRAFTDCPPAHTCHYHRESRDILVAQPARGRVVSVTNTSDIDSLLAHRELRHDEAVVVDSIQGRVASALRVRAPRTRRNSVDNALERVYGNREVTFTSSQVTSLGQRLPKTSHHLEEIINIYEWAGVPWQVALHVLAESQGDPEITTDYRRCQDRAEGIAQFLCSHNDAFSEFADDLAQSGLDLGRYRWKDYPLQAATAAAAHLSLMKIYEDVGLVSVAITSYHNGWLFERALEDGESFHNMTGGDADPIDVLTTGFALAQRYSGERLWGAFRSASVGHPKIWLAMQPIALATLDSVSQQPINRYSAPHAMPYEEAARRARLSEPDFGRENPHLKGMSTIAAGESINTPYATSALGPSEKFWDHLTPELEQVLNDLQRTPIPRDEHGAKLLMDFSYRFAEAGSLPHALGMLYGARHLRNREIADVDEILARRSSTPAVRRMLSAATTELAR